MENEKAVTPIVGTIMLVALTVVLAAIVAAFLFGFAGQSLQTTHIVSATMQRVDTSHVSMTYYVGQDAAALLGMTFTVNDKTNITVTTGSTLVTISGNQVMANSGGTIPIGLGVTIPATNPKKDHIVITGLFSDGSSAIIAESTL
ncbi:MAG: type IV pilin N-terminal domain-containing protein [Dehalococcoidales bacterium]|nr:type IV pilin N-terminal domain-containing protein [Dehalococcoidales bacterium]